jgi:type IV pilus assembly protein PilC
MTRATKLGIRVIVAILVIVTTHVGAFMLIFIVPQFERKWDSYGLPLSLGQELLISASHMTSQYWFLVLPMVPLILGAAVLFVVGPFFRGEASRTK